jgi:hypothetical protein
MQEKSTSSSNAKIKYHTTPEERQAHVEKWKKSGLSMSDYCRQNNLAISNLSGWKSSLLKDSAQCKPFQPLSLPEPVKPTNVVEILVDQRIKIRLQHVTDVALIINIAKGLLPCS